MGSQEYTPELIHPPLVNSGSLSYEPYNEITPIIGRIYPSLKIKDILSAPNRDQQILDLAIIISERGVVCFRESQLDLSVEELKTFTDLLGKLSGRPKENGLHVHPLFRDEGNVRMGNGEVDENM